MSVMEFWDALSSAAHDGGYRLLSCGVRDDSPSLAFEVVLMGTLGLERRIYQLEPIRR